MPAEPDMPRSPRTHLIIQISDTHLVDRSVPMFRGIDPQENLTRALAMVSESGLTPDLLLITGDLTDAGEPAAYRRVRELVDPAAAGFGCPVMYLMGNHDERTAFAAAMLGDQGPVRVGATGLQECTVRGLRVIGLDSVVAGQNYGHLGAPQLDALADALATPAEHGTIVAMHHPPIRTPVPGIDDIGLDNPGALATAMAGGDVRMVVAGHTHHATGGAIGAIPVWVSGGCVYWSDAFSPAGRGRGVVGGQFSRIDVFDSSVVATAIPLGPHRPVYELDPVS